MDDFAAALKLIETHDIITIFGHTGPDGDCYGSQIALRELIRDNFPNKKAYAVGSGLPSFFERIAPMDEVDEATIASSLAVLVDVSCLRRVEDPRVYAAQAFLKFDHHLPSPLEEFDGVAIVDSQRIAACEILAELALSAKWKISPVAADAMWLGMCTDSGRFLYQGTTPRTIYLQNFLRRKGARVRSLMKIAYYESPEVKRVKQIISKCAKLDETIAYAILPLGAAEKCGISAQKAVRLVNVIGRKYECANAYVLFAYVTERQIDVELRSNKGYPVHGVAKAFGGGGHRFASGCTIYIDEHSPEEVIAMMKQVEASNDAGV